MKPCTLIASFLFSAAVINSASAACFCEEPLGVNYLAINSSDIQEKAFHIMKNVYHNATDLFRKIDMPLVSYTSQSYEVNKEGQCFRAVVEGGTYLIDNETFTATISFTGEALKDGLQNTLCGCIPHPEGPFDPRVCDLLRIRSAQRIAVVKDRVENKRCKQT